MTSTVREIIRDIRLYELGIKDKLDGYDTLMSLRGLDSSKSYYEGSETYYGKTIDDIKFKYHYNRGYIHIKKEVWVSIKDSFNLTYDETKELIMWAIGSYPNLKGIPTQGLKWIWYSRLGVTPI